MDNQRIRTLKKAFAQVDAETFKNFGVDIKKISKPNTKKTKVNSYKKPKKAVFINQQINKSKNH